MSYTKFKYAVTASLTTDKVKEILEELGCTNCVETSSYLIFPTICHHVHEEDGSNKLYYYKNSHLFVCYTHCGTFDIFDLVEKRY